MGLAKVVAEHGGSPPAISIMDSMASSSKGGASEWYQCTLDGFPLELFEKFTEMLVRGQVVERLVNCG